MRPKAVYDNLHTELRPKTNPLTEFARLLRYWPVYPALLIWGLWSFAPGSERFAATVSIRSTHSLGKSTVICCRSSALFGRGILDIRTASLTR